MYTNDTHRINVNAIFCSQYKLLNITYHSPNSFHKRFSAAYRVKGNILCTKNKCMYTRQGSAGRPRCHSYSMWGYGCLKVAHPLRPPSLLDGWSIDRDKRLNVNILCVSKSKVIENSFFGLQSIDFKAIVNIDR